MSIHEKIKAARERKGWSHQQVADAVSEAEGLKKTLAWQTVQQWENGTSAPKRNRMAVVARVLDVPLTELLGLAESDLSADEQNLLSHFRSLEPHIQQFVLRSVVGAVGGAESDGTDVPPRKRKPPESGTGSG